jgi:predicted RNA-binding protein Jag
MKDQIFEGDSVEAALGEAARVLGLRREGLPHVVLQSVGPARVAVLLGARPAAPGGRAEAMRSGGERPRERKPERQPDGASEGRPIEADVRAVVQALGQAAGLDASADCERRESGLAVRVQGDPGFFSAEVVRALEIVLRGVAARAGFRGPVRVHVDGTEEREAALRRLAEEAAEAVRRDGQPRTLPALNSWERRQVHVTLQDYPDVVSSSSGEGRERTLTVSRRAGEGA